MYHAIGESAICMEHGQLIHKVRLHTSFQGCHHHL